MKLAATLLDPPAAPRLTIEADGTDQDGDDIDDLALRATVEGGAPPFEGPKLGAVWKWLDRPAGLSRDPGPTETSFATLAQTAMTRAARTKDASSVPAHVAQMRALYRAMCPEAGATRLVHKLGSATITCGSSRMMEDAGIAEVRAYATLGDPLRAALALDAAQKPPRRRPPREPAIRN